jgi:phosphotransferase system HPr (HPr) family protein
MSNGQMKRSQVLVRWNAGLHLRPAARLVRLAQTFHSTILLKCGGKLADARSIISVMLLAAAMNAVIEIEATGVDEANAAQAIEQIFSSADDGGSSDYQKPG